MPSYVSRSITSSSVIRLATAYELQTAAKAELLKHSTILDTEKLYQDARGAFRALETLLAVGDTGWFFGTTGPGLFDSAIFAYTGLLLQDWDWKDSRLREQLNDCPNLRQHRDSILDLYF